MNITENISLIMIHYIKIKPIYEASTNLDL